MSVLVILFLSLLSPASCFNISFPVFDPGSCSGGGNLICMGSVNISNQSLIITPDPTINAFGRVLYQDPMIAWPASFDTTFTIKIVNSSASLGADGMAFVLAQNSNPSPSLSFGSYMGIFDQTTEGVLRQIAIEFDTFKNEYDPDDNHIAINTVSVEKPVAVRSLNSTGINLKSRREITVKIEYDGWSKNMQISVAHVGEPLVSFLNHTMRMKGSVPSSVYVGFTGATGTLLETHQVLSWNFTSVELPKQSLGGGKKRALLIIVIPTVLCSMFSCNNCCYTICEKEYLAEICTIGRLRHKNLLQLQVVCGKRSNGIMEENNLVECVWKLYEKGELLDCVDEELEGKYDETQVRRSLLVGLACLHPDYTLRPRMRKVVHIFMNSDEPLMSLPASRPLSVCLLFGSSASTTPNVTYSTALYRGHTESFPDETTDHDDQL
ncbi:hypothetical protein Acr_25g0011080 [Actinidia rufa]|uniref:Legume lectin domain-containing protein n=1 Tax=Actinidia rufa TaxID=165716 RepID=A0A7J0H0T6_9ERIC|nr:hypothetical protein Acr_25g0011080 [Actinidia rufa]